MRDVAEDFSDAHDGDVLCADDLLLVLASHLGAAETGKGRVGKAGAECSDDLCAVGVTRGFAGREEDPRIGESSNGSSLSFVCCGREVAVPLTWSARWLRVR
jgi:hypothetical protein